MGAGDDVFQWNPGDGNDTLEGQDGTDEMLFFGANIGENIDVVANGGRVRFFRNVANVTMDLDDVEDIDFRALGGADNIVVGDLTGTDVTPIGLDLRGPNGGGDGAADTVTVNGTQGADVFGAAGDAGGVNVFGLKADGPRLLPGAGQRPADAQRAGRRGHDQRLVAGGRRHAAHAERRPRRRPVRSAAMAATWSTAATATTSRSWVPATTCSSGTRATTTTRSRARAASTGCCSTASNVAENINVGAERRTCAVHPRRRDGHDGPRRRREHRLQGTGRCRQRRRQRPQRHGRDRGERRPGRRSRRRGRRGGQRHVERDQRRRRQPDRRRRVRRVRAGPRGAGEHHRLRGRQRPPDGQPAGWRRRARGLRPGGRRRSS